MGIVEPVVGIIILAVLMVGAYELGLSGNCNQYLTIMDYGRAHNLFFQQENCTNVYERGGIMICKTENGEKQLVAMLS